MKKVKILLCIIITISLQANSSSFEIDSTTNIFDKIQVNSGSKWALDGGVFKDIKSNVYLKHNGDYVLMILEPSGEITAYNITINNGQSQQHNVVNTLVIDNKAPKIDIRWEHVIYKGNQVMVGPKSQLHWQIDEPGPRVNIIINDKFTQSIQNPIQLTNDMSKISLQSIDEFNNESMVDVAFTKDFKEPVISWKLKSPSVEIDNQWYANKTARLEIQKSNSVSYWINGKPLLNNYSDYEINNNSMLQASNILGNQTTERIQWLEDNVSPQLTVSTLGKTYVDIKKIKVKVGQKIKIQTIDDVVGILNSEYFGNNREWLPLPKTFVFIDTGLYRLKIKASDTLGNKLITYIVFTITK